MVCVVRECVRTGVGVGVSLRGVGGVRGLEGGALWRVCVCAFHCPDSFAYRACGSHCAAFPGAVVVTGSGRLLFPFKTVLRQGTVLVEGSGGLLGPDVTVANRLVHAGVCAGWVEG